MGLRYIAALILAGAIGATIWSCGPSFRRTYQSDNAFERCFDMDYNPAISSNEKAHCWSGWLDDYVYNQPEDKVDYARLRLEELHQGISVPGPPGPPGAFFERPQVGEAPGEEGEEPAEPVQGADGGTELQDGGVREKAPETFDCEMLCRTTFDACADSCSGSDPTPCETACNQGYKACMKSCFK